MYNLSDETLLTLEDAAKDFGGKAISIATVRKYVYRGVKGVKLETIFINRRYTSEEAIQRFIAQRQGTVLQPKKWIKPMSAKQVDKILREHGMME
jgi:hypothetical protein